MEDCDKRRSRRLRLIARLCQDGANLNSPAKYPDHAGFHPPQSGYIFSALHRLNSKHVAKPSISNSSTPYSCNPAGGTTPPVSPSVQLHTVAIGAEDGPGEVVVGVGGGVASVFDMGPVSWLDTADIVGMVAFLTEVDPQPTQHTRRE